MSLSPSSNQYAPTLKDARGVVIGEHNQVYQSFLSERYAPLSHKLISFTSLIEEKTRDFVGRRFVIDKLDEYLRRTSSGYFIIKGEAGIGKSALMAHLVKERGYVHHFVVGPQGINRADQFLENACAQVIARYKLDRPSWLPPEAARDSAFLANLLAEVSQGLERDQKAVLVIDALDEVDWRGRSDENILYLPPALPPGVFMAVSSRHKEDMTLQVEASQIFYLEANSPDNREDVLAFIRTFAARPAMQPRLQTWGADSEAFAQTMLEKSEGNFMYLHHVLPAIEQGVFVTGTLAELPQGLRNYYERHWQQMRRIDEDSWVNYRQPVICFLAAAPEPVTVWQIAEWSHLPPARVLAAIRDWRQFLDEEVSGEGKRYRIYHASFQEFLAAKDEAKEINLRQTHSAVADDLLRQYAAMTGGQTAPAPSRPAVDYVKGLQRLQVQLEANSPELRSRFWGLEARLLENLNAESKYGQDQGLRQERMQIVDQLNGLAADGGLASSFNQLCRT